MKRHGTTVPHIPSQVIYDWFRRLDELVIDYNSGSIIDYANSREFLTVLSRALGNRLVGFEHGNKRRPPFHNRSHTLLPSSSAVKTIKILGGLPVFQPIQAVSGISRPYTMGWDSHFRSFALKIAYIAMDPSQAHALLRMELDRLSVILQSTGMTYI